MIDASVALHQWFIIFLIKSPLVLLLIQGQELILKANINKKNLTNQILENLENLNYIHPLRTTFRVLVQHIGN